MRVGTRPLMLIAGITLVLTGCGSTSPRAGSAATQPTVVPSTTVSSTTSPSPVVQPTPSATPSVRIDLSSYQDAGILSPTGRIGCAFEDFQGAPSVRCDVANAAWKVAVPPTCHLAYGDSVDLGQGTAGLGCHGDTVIGSVPHQPTLPYGGDAVFHNITCTAADTGITCRNATGHGFMVSSQTYSIF